MMVPIKNTFKLMFLVTNFVFNCVFYLSLMIFFASLNMSSIMHSKDFESLQNSRNSTNFGT